MRQRLHTLAPIAAGSVTFATLLLSVLCTKISKQYTGGLTWPYVSDVMRDAPGYYINAVVAVPIAVLLVLSYGFNYAFQRAVLGDAVSGFAIPQTLHRLLLASVVAGVLSTLGLVLLAVCSNTSFPLAHRVAAYGLVLLTTLAIGVNTLVSYTIQRRVRAVTDLQSYTLDGVHAPPPSPERQRLRALQLTFYKQLSCAVVFVLAVLLYGPIGSTLVDDATHLTIDELGESYCTDTMKLNALDTTLWNYTNDATANELRAVAEWLSIGALVSYVLTFATHNYDDELAQLARRGFAQSTHFYSLAVLPTPPPPLTTATTRASLAPMPALLLSPALTKQTVL